MRVSLSPLGRETAMIMCGAIVVMVIISMLDEILYRLKYMPVTVVHYREIKDVAERDDAPILDEEGQGEGSKPRASNGRFAKRKDGDPPISEVAT